MIPKWSIPNIEAAMEATWKLHNLIALTFHYQQTLLGITANAADCIPDTHPDGYPDGKTEVCMTETKGGFSAKVCFCRTDLCNAVPKNNGGVALTSRNAVYINAILSSCLSFLW